MNLYSKIALLACGVAIASSAVTVFAVDVLNGNDMPFGHCFPLATRS